MNQLRQEHKDAKSAIKNNEDLTPDARQRKLAALEINFVPKHAHAQEAVAAAFQRAKDKAYAKAARGPNMVRRPHETPGAFQDRASELQLARGEVRDQLELGKNPLGLYRHYRRLGEMRHARFAGEMGLPRLEDAKQRREMRELITQDLPEEVREAQDEQAALAGKKRQHDLGEALRRQVHR